ncbi:MAG: chromate transporter [Clostridiales bacterium]|nr:chromate transporter [Clostridiales bacterium]
MIYWELFMEFVKIGAVSLGGGYGMIALIREMVFRNGWMTDRDFTSFIAVSESTPGPLAVNMATFIGSSQAGLPGALCATVGVVLPSFLIILLIAAVMHNLLSYSGVQAFLKGVRPCIVAMILATGILMLLNLLLSVATVNDLTDGWQFDVRSGVILLILLGVHIGTRKRYHQEPSPIVMILISAVLGIVLWSIR